jgi:hypothetical protein
MLLRGKIHMNGYIVFILIVSPLAPLCRPSPPLQVSSDFPAQRKSPLTHLKLANIALLIGAILTTLDGMELAEPEAQYSNVCLGMVWAAVVCVFFAFAGEFLEWNIQRFTPKGERVGMSWRSRDAPWFGYGRSNGYRR